MYSYSKLAGEELCWAYQREYGIPSVILRFAYVIGAGEILNKLYFPFIWSSRILEQLNAIKEKTPAVLNSIAELENKTKGEERLLITYGPDGKAGKHSFVDVRDLVQGILLALEKESAIGEAFNLAGPAPILFSELVPYISEKTGIPYVTVTLPWKQMDCELSIAKARALLGYLPQYDGFRMVDSAILFKEGKDTTVVERLQPKV
jgi:nucleoside-diphosphate-sugar epimerase